MKQFTSKTQKIGEFGEKLALKFLISKGFSLIERNYTKKIGEIDLVVQKGGVIHFVEVKTLVYAVSHETKDVSRETYNIFDNFSHHKLRKLSKTVAWYLAERHVSRETLWVIDVVGVSIFENQRRAKVDVLWNVIGGV
jgi:putative endonuclease